MGDSYNKKADMEQHPAKAVFHVGLLINEPPGRAVMPFVSCSAVPFYQQSTCRTTASVGKITVSSLPIQVLN